MIVLSKCYQVFKGWGLELGRGHLSYAQHITCYFFLTHPPLHISHLCLECSCPSSNMQSDTRCLYSHLYLSTLSMPSLQPAIPISCFHRVLCMFSCYVFITESCNYLLMFPSPPLDFALGKMKDCGMCFYVCLCEGMCGCVQKMFPFIPHTELHYSVQKHLLSTHV